MHPKPLKVAAADEKLIFLLMGCCEVVVVSLERSRDEIVDLERVDWICFVLRGSVSVSVSEMGLWFLLLIWFLDGFLHFICCCSVFVSCVTEDMFGLVWLEKNQQEIGRAHV